MKNLKWLTHSTDTDTSFYDSFIFTNRARRNQNQLVKAEKVEPDCLELNPSFFCTPEFSEM